MECFGGSLVCLVPLSSSSFSLSLFSSAARFFLLYSWFFFALPVSIAKRQALGSPGASGDVLLVLTRVTAESSAGPVICMSSLLFSLCLAPAVYLCVRLGSCLLFPLSAVKLLGRPRVSLSLSFFCLCVLAPRVSRLTLTLTCSDNVQLGLPVDLCVRELCPPLSIVDRRLWRVW